MSTKSRYIFQMRMLGHYFIYHVIASTPRHARTLIKKAIKRDNGPEHKINMRLDLVKAQIIY